MFRGDNPQNSREGYLPPGFQGGVNNPNNPPYGRHWILDIRIFRSLTLLQKPYLWSCEFPTFGSDRLNRFLRLLDTNKQKPMGRQAKDILHYTHRYLNGRFIHLVSLNVRFLILKFQFFSYFKFQNSFFLRFILLQGIVQNFEKHQNFKIFYRLTRTSIKAI